MGYSNIINLSYGVRLTEEDSEKLDAYARDKFEEDPGAIYDDYEDIRSFVDGADARGQNIFFNDEGYYEDYPLYFGMKLISQSAGSNGDRIAKELQRGPSLKILTKWHEAASILTHAGIDVTKYEPGYHITSETL